MDYKVAWDCVKEKMLKDSNCSGEVMSMEEWVGVTSNAYYYLKLMERLEKEIV